MALGQSGQYFYSPDIAVYINSLSQGGIIDVSADVVSFQISRQVNATSTAVLTLSNNGFKYTPSSIDDGTQPTVINTMDSIMIFLKRENYLQYFTGFVTYCPVVNLIPSPIEIHASCTLYKLENSYWDSNSIQLQKIIPGFYFVDKNKQDVYADGGAGIGIKNVLVDIANFKESQVHLARLPDSWLDQAKALYNSTQGTSTNSSTSNNTFNLAFSAVGMVAGKTTTFNTTFDGTVLKSPSNNSITTGVGIPGGMSGMTIVPVDDTGSYQFLEQVGSLSIGSNPQTQYDKIADYTLDPYWISIPFPYWVGLSIVNGKLDQKYDKTSARQWLTGNLDPKYPAKPSGKKLTGGYAGAGRLVYVESSDLQRGMYVRVCFASPLSDLEAGLNKEPLCKISVAAWKYLTGTEPSNTSNTNPQSNFKTVYSPGFAAPGIKVSLKSGPNHNINLPASNTPSAANSNNISDNYLNTQPGTSASATKTDVSNIGLVAAKAAIATIGTPYIYGGGHFSQISNYKVINGQIVGAGVWAGVDCSGLTDYCYLKASHSIGAGTADSQMHGTAQQGGRWVQMPWIPVGQSPPYALGVAPSKTQITKFIDSLQPGDLLYWNDGSGTTAEHTQIYVGGGYSVGANGSYAKGKNSTTGIGTGDGGKVASEDLASKISLRWYGDLIGVRRPSNNDNIPNRSPLAAPLGKGNAALIPDSSIKTTGNTANLAINSPLGPAPALDLLTQSFLGTPRAFITDTSAMATVTQLATSSFRCFQSAPNGDFVSWFPDYYGLYGTAPAMDIEDIEVIDFKMMHDDTQLKTHIGISGDPVTQGTSVSFADWLQTTGIISVQVPQIFRALFNINKNQDVNVPIENFLYRYGMRPLVQEVPQIKTLEMEFAYAWQTFLNSWANQFASFITLTFMPEIYPGMILRFPNHKLQVYVQSVTHIGNRTTGFSTEISVTSATRLKLVSSVDPISGQSVQIEVPVPLDVGYANVLKQTQTNIK